MQCEINSHKTHSEKHNNLYLCETKILFNIKTHLHNEKTYLLRLFSGILALTAVIGCTSQEDEDLTTLAQNDGAVIVNVAPMDSLLDVVAKVSSIMERHDSLMMLAEDASRAASVMSTGMTKTEVLSATEKSIAQANQSYVQSGLQMQAVVLKNPEMACLSKSDMEIISEMTDDQLALASIALTAVIEYANQYNVGKDDPRMIHSSNIYLDCLIEALDIDDVVDVVKTIVECVGGGCTIPAIANASDYINAKTVAKLVRAMARKYAGWIGVACILYDYGNCLNSHRG